MFRTPLAFPLALLLSLALLVPMSGCSMLEAAAGKVQTVTVSAFGVQGALTFEDGAATEPAARFLDAWTFEPVTEIDPEAPAYVLELFGERITVSGRTAAELAAGGIDPDDQAAEDLDDDQAAEGPEGAGEPPGGMSAP